MSAFVNQLCLQHSKTVHRRGTAARWRPTSLRSRFSYSAHYSRSRNNARSRNWVQDEHVFSQKRSSTTTVSSTGIHGSDHGSSSRKATPATIPQTGEGITFSSAYSEQIPQWLLSRMTCLGFSTPTLVQKSVLEHALPSIATATGQDVVIHAQTGSGKTLAYLLPALTSTEPKRSSVQALVIVPTQELGMQVYRLLRSLVSLYPQLSTNDDDGNGSESETEPGTEVESKKHNASFPVLAMLDQADFRRQKLQLRQVAPRVVVGNPLRVAQLVDSGRLRLDLLKVLVVDEFDACLLDTTTTNALQTILSVRGRERPRQTILASATVPQHRHFLRQCVRQRWTRPDIKHIWVEEKSNERVPPSLKHWYAMCDGRKKLAALRTLLIRFNKESSNGATGGLNIRAMVFVMPSRKIDDIVDALNQSFDQYFGVGEGKLVVGLSDNLSIIHRRQAMKRFRDGGANVLIATDVAARGLDIPDVSHVFHLDLPTDPDSYLHRSGRTGRQGRPGSSVVLVTPGEQFVVSRTGNALGIDFQRVEK